MCLVFFEVCMRSRSRNWLASKIFGFRLRLCWDRFAYFFRQNDWGKALDWGVRVWVRDRMSAKGSEFESDPRPFIFGFRFPVFCTYEVEVLELENLDYQLLRPLSSLSTWPLRNWNFVERVVIAAVVVDFFVVVELVT